MLTKEQTHQICVEFYKDCYEHWLRDFENNKTMQSERDKTKTIEQDAQAWAIRDLQNLERNPFSPSGELVDQEAKGEFLENLVLL